MRLVSLVLLVCLSGILDAQSIPAWQGPLTVADGSFGFRGPRLALRGDGVPVVLWGRSGAGMDSLFVAVGDGGGGFADPVGLPLGGVEPFVNSVEGPVLAVNGMDVFVAFGSLTAPHGYVVHSPDGGNTWLPPVQATPLGTQLSLISMSTDREGGVHVAFLDVSGIVPAYWYTRSADGISFSDPVPINTSTPGIVCECCWADIRVAGDTIQVFFRNNDANVRDIRVVRSLDGGLSFTEQLDLDPTDWVIAGCPVAGPDALPIGDSVYTVFMSSATPPAQIYLAAHDPVNWVGGSFRALAPRLARTQKTPRLAGEGNLLAAVWTETGGGSPAKARALLSQSGMPGLRGTGQALGDSTVSVNVPDIAFAESVFHAVFEQGGQVWYQRTDAASGISSVMQSMPGLVLYPQPSRFGFQQVQWDAAPKQWHARWMSLDGRLGELFRLSGPGPHTLSVPEGSGGWWFSAEGQEAWRALVPHGR